jgi:hypothetical protein
MMISSANLAMCIADRGPNYPIQLCHLRFKLKLAGVASAQVENIFNDIGHLSGGSARDCGDLTRRLKYPR